MPSNFDGRKVSDADKQYNTFTSYWRAIMDLYCQQQQEVTEELFNHTHPDGLILKHRSIKELTEYEENIQKLKEVPEQNYISYVK